MNQREIEKALIDAGMEKAAAKKLAKKIVEKPGSGKTEAVAGAVSAPVIKGVDEMLKELTKITFGLDKNLDTYQRVTESARLYRAELEEFTKAGYTRQFQDFSSEIDSAIETSLRLTGNLEAAQLALSGLKKDFKGFGLVSKQFRSGLTDISTKLAAAGYDMASFGRVVDSSVFAFNAGSEQINQMSNQLVTLQQNLAIAPQELTANFEYAQKNFAYSAGKIMENFAKLSKMSRQTGLDFSKLAGSFGDSLDTFEGSAQMAGRLNQILGDSVFNSVELLSMDEATRAKRVREQLQARMGGRLENIGKFELKAVASTLNMTPEEARRFLRTGQLKAGGVGMDKVNRQDMAQFEQKKANEAVMQTRDAFEDLEKSLRSFRYPLEELVRVARGRTSEATRSAVGFLEGRRFGENQQFQDLGMDPRLGIDYGQKLQLSLDKSGAFLATISGPGVAEDVAGIFTGEDKDGNKVSGGTFERIKDAVGGGIKKVLSPVAVAGAAKFSRAYLRESVIVPRPGMPAPTGRNNPTPVKQPPRPTSDIGPQAKVITRSPTFVAQGETKVKATKVSVELDKEATENFLSKLASMGKTRHRSLFGADTELKMNLMGA